ncbi:hypothetical protein DKG77_01135 [Flagellimonas aquimarina]|uniref:Uncharacterized protein n=1 Tax=Flagellimonas aquimarina TaxID=2201895 RepID=A0A316L0V6_9FLAO|nr:hypothetical protein [Allomuricauda koreensis]PWL39471.1 hypothetical protein DKG77_01135 [Allomuricauda koreensis]
MKTSKLLVICLLSISFVKAQSKSFSDDMKTGFDTYSNGETFSDWKKGAEILEKVSESYKDQWLPNYWASYFYTQLVRNIPKDNRPEGVTEELLLKKAQENIDKAYGRIEKMNQKMKSDFHALQSLIYNFSEWTSVNEVLKKEFHEKAETELKRAISSNSNNPLTDVIVATNLIKKGEYQSVYAGRVLLLNAKSKYDMRIEPRYMSSHWNEQWIGYWLGSANKGVEFLTKTE